ncbi:MAG: hypothetical protein ABTR07_15645 [Candidatus Competibacter denitrificans]
MKGQVLTKQGAADYDAAWGDGVKRLTREELITTRLSMGLRAGELYLITDEQRLAVGLSATIYIDVGPIPTPTKTLERLVSPLPLLVGRYYDQSLTAATITTLTGAAGRIDLTPLCFPMTVAVDRIGFRVSSPVAGATGRVVIYTSDSLGQPDQRYVLYDPPLSMAAVAFVEHTPITSTVFSANVLYWVGIHYSSTPTVNAIPATALRPLGFNSTASTNYATVIRKTITYANGPPLAFGFTAANLTENVAAPSIRFRVAS